MTQTSDRVRVLARFTKPGGHRAEIHERKQESSRFSGAIEYAVFVNGSFLGGELFQREQYAEYSASLDSRIQQFTNDGWTLEALTKQVSTEFNRSV